MNNEDDSCQNPDRRVFNWNTGARISSARKAHTRYASYQCFFFSSFIFLSLHPWKRNLTSLISSIFICPKRKKDQIIRKENEFFFVHRIGKFLMGTKQR